MRMRTQVTQVIHGHGAGQGVPRVFLTCGSVSVGFSGLLSHPKLRLSHCFSVRDFTGYPQHASLAKSNRRIGVQFVWLWHIYTYLHTEGIVAQACAVPSAFN